MAEPGNEGDRHEHETFKNYHDEAFKLIENATEMEAAGNYNEAVLTYKAGLILIEEAIKIQFNHTTSQQLDKISDKKVKMANARQEVLLRIEHAKSLGETSQSLPSYEEATSSQPTVASANAKYQTYNELGLALQALSVDGGPRPAEVIYTNDSVRMYFISADGTVSVPSENQTLTIGLFQDEALENAPRAFLQVGEWVYPLFPRVSPCYHTEYGAFILPDVHSADEGSAVGLLLPDGANADVLEILSNILECVITQPTPKLRTRALGEEGFSFTISHGLVKGAQFISDGLVKGAQTASGYMNSSTPKLIQHIHPGENPSYVNPTLSQGMNVAKNVTSSAVTATTYIANTIGWATMALGRYLAPHIQQQGTRLLTTTTNLSGSEASQTVEGALQIAAGAVEGFGTVYAGLENSAGILASCLANNTVRIVEHKYGQPAGRVTEDTFHTVGNVITASSSAKYFTPKGLAKLSAKQTGKAVVEDYRASLRETKEEK